MRLSTFAFGLFVVALFAAPALANTESSPAEHPADCIAADAKVMGKVELIRSRQGMGAVLNFGDVLAAVARARALCAAGEPERGMLVYLRITDALNNAARLQARADRP
jgi:hypothetical protein